jgi:hypothetical protein
MKRTLGLVGAALLCGSMLAYAQQTPGGERTPEQRRQMHERMKGMMEACKDKADRRACMHEQMCAKAQDPAKCVAEGKARMMARMEERQKMHEACNGKRGEELAKCLGEQRKNHPHHRRHHGDKPRA